MIVFNNTIVIEPQHDIGLLIRSALELLNLPFPATKLLKKGYTRLYMLSYCHVLRCLKCSMSFLGTRP